LYFSSLCVVGCSYYGSIPELTLDVFYPLFPRNEEHNEIFELSFHLPKKLLNRIIKKKVFGEKKISTKINLFAFVVMLV